jgi:deazaflavin-dependent oxidoreductase (nitroreductase family)
VSLELLPASPRPWQRLFQKIAALRPVSWLLARGLPPADRWLLRRTGGRTTLATLLTGLPVVVLTTTGARSGQPHSVPLVPLVDGEAVILVASAFGSQHHPAWYYNLHTNPQATLSKKGRQASYQAREATPDEWQRYWEIAVATYPGYAGYRERCGPRQIPILVLTPLENSAQPRQLP